MYRTLIVFILFVVTGCGDSYSDRTRSQVQVIAKNLWTGEDHFESTVKDAWGNQILVKVRITEYFNTIEVRSAGADGLYYTDDDIIAVNAINHPDVKNGVKDGQ